jgi:hypothetical protein
MSANRRLKVLSVEGIVSALKPGKNYQVSNLATRFGTRGTTIRHFLELAAAEGLIDRVRDHGETCYRLVWSQDEPENIVPPAYRNLRLAENLTDYDRDLHSFEALCMTVRR